MTTTKKTIAKGKKDRADAAPNASPARRRLRSPIPSESLTQQFKELECRRSGSVRGGSDRSNRGSLSHLELSVGTDDARCQVRREGDQTVDDASQLRQGKTWHSFRPDSIAAMNVRSSTGKRFATESSLIDGRTFCCSGKPGSGKSHALCALAEQLVLSGRSILFTTCSLWCSNCDRETGLASSEVDQAFSSVRGLIIATWV